MDEVNEQARGLSAEKRREGLRLYRLFFAANGIPVAVLLESVLVLYGIRNGLSDSALAALVSFNFLTMPFLFLGRPLAGRVGLARAWASMWTARYVFVSLLLVAPWLPSVGARTVVILAGAFGFSFFRAMGVLNNQPILAELTEGEERGRYMNGNTLRYNVVYGLAVILVTLIIQRYEGIGIYQVLILAAVAAGIASARIVRHIPESPTLRMTAREPLRAAIRETWANPRLRALVWTWAAGFSASVLVLSMALVAAKNGYGVSDGTAVTLLLISVVGSIVASLVNQEILDAVGPRPLMVVYMAVFLGAALFWVVAPRGYHGWLVGTVFFAAGFAKNGMNVALQLYLLSAATEKERLTIAMLVEAVGGLAAGISGTVIAGGSFAFFGRWLSGMPLYRVYFVVVTFLMVWGVYLARRLDRLESWRVRHAVALLASPRTLWAMATLNRIPGAVAEARPSTPQEVRTALRRRFRLPRRGG